MIQDTAWIGAIDHRISASIVFFVLVLLLNVGKRRGHFALRAAAMLVAMCLTGWLLRTLSDEWLQDIRLQGLCFPPRSWRFISCLWRPVTSVTGWALRKTCIMACWR